MCYYLVVISMKIELIEANAHNVSVANELLTMLIKTEKSYIENIKDDFATKFDDIKESKSSLFINLIERIDCIYNKTKEIYFDK